MTRSVLLFDGVCTLCHGFVQFVIKRDPASRFQFASLQSGAAQRLLTAIQAPRRLPDSLLLVEGDRLFTRSAAALRVARGLRFPWPLAYVLVGVPRPLRDWIYDVIARNRYAWFGKEQACLIPTPEIRSRFLNE